MPNEEKRIPNRKDRRAYMAQLIKNKKTAQCKIVGDKATTLHPTKGFRTTSIPREGIVDIKPNDLDLVKYFKYQFQRKFGVRANG